MLIEDIIRLTEAMGGVLVQRPGPGDGTPELAWGDVFFYYAPDGVIPKAQPFATIVTKDYPGDDTSRLGRPGAFRINVAAGATEFRRQTGHDPKDPAGPAITGDDVVMAHPVYGSMGWLAVANPGPATSDTVAALLATAHGMARGRYERHAERSRPPGEQ
ncbi:DUF6194 family protein [Longispora albida]|uniref:DUF6194 family protein n=1 Tax=Longispora albida TaxID=203523 RepID=UPI0003745826|nr:DUF6194 family protein [Longispora albida]